MTALLQKSSSRWILVVVGLVVMAAISPFVVDPIARQIQFSMMPNPARDQSSGVLQLFRGFQMSLADICYNKSTLYQHRGVRYSIALHEDILGDEVKQEQDTVAKAAEEGTTTPAKTAEHAGAEGAPAAGPHHHHHHITVIPTKANDFRGIIGEVERNVKPFATYHVHHTKPEEALPWLRLATWINPQHEKAWVATAFWLHRTRTPHATSKAISIMEQAIAINPLRKGVPYKKQGIPYMLGNLYLFSAKRPDKAYEVLIKAVEHGEKDFAELDSVEREWLLFNFRNLVFACRKLKRHEEAIQICKRGLALFPEDGPLRKALKKEQRLLQKAAKKSS